MNHNISSVVAAQNCAGCGACAADCPQHAITLRENCAGFYEACVDTALCVHCGRCLQICPRLHPMQQRTLCEGRLFAAQSSSPDVVHACSSGGIAHELSIAFLEAGAYVGGAIYDLGTHRVRHTLISDISALSRLDGSKYLQSNPSEAFREALQLAATDCNTRFLLFGTPCQIAGLAAAAEKQHTREQFLLVELFCHGVPSYRVWDESVRTISDRLGTKAWDSVRFRYKKDDWHSYCLRVEAGQKHYYGKRERELFWQVFFENILLSDACWSCSARTERSCADLRLGDYWGTRFIRHSDGVSAVFAMTERGCAAMSRLLQERRIRTFEVGSADEMLLAQNMAGYQQTAIHHRAMEQLRGGVAVQTVVAQYRKSFTPKQKAKSFLLRLSAALPDSMRAKARKLLSGRTIRKG